MLNGKLRVVIRGRPAYSEFPDFDQKVKEEPYMDFMGSYRFPDDLQAIYRAVDFNWVIDFFEEGGNSEWLLPNRLYEGGLFGAVPLYVAGNQTAAECKAMGIGVALKKPLANALYEFFTALDMEKYQQLKAQSLSVPKHRWQYSSADCQTLVALLSNATLLKMCLRHELYRLNAPETGVILQAEANGVPCGF